MAKLITSSQNNPYLQGRLSKTRKEYKNIIEMKKKEWKFAMTQKLETLEGKDPKEYWKMVSQLWEKKQSSLKDGDDEDPNN